MHQLLTLDDFEHHLLETLVNQPTEKMPVEQPQQAATYPRVQMIFTCRSHSPEAVKLSLQEADLYFDQFATMGANISIFFDDDLCFYALKQWESDAIGCCLITQSQIER